MRNVIIILMMLFGTALYSQDYLSILTKGKSWKCTYMTMVPSENLNYTATVDKDTIYDNQTWKKICLKADKDGRDEWYMLREEEGKLYVHFNDNDGFKKILLMDFNLQKGDEIEIITPLYSTLQKEEKIGISTQTYTRTIQDVDTINVDGVLRKRLTIDRDSDGKRNCWIEGIGSNCTSWLTDFPKSTDGCYWVLGSCFYDGHEFTLDDFQAEPVSGINDVTFDKPRNNVMYDLTGKRLVTPHKNKVVISNGKKIIAR